MSILPERGCGPRVSQWLGATSGDEDQGTVVQVAVTAIVIAESPRAVTENREHVRMLAEAPGELPPIIVHRRTMHIIDGVHRLLAAKLRNQAEISVRFFSGSDDDAFVLSVQSNVKHGLPLSLAEREMAAKRIVGSHPQWSDRMIAVASGLSPGTVAELRRRQAPEPHEALCRVGRDGRLRPVDSSAGRIHAAELMGDDPGMSLRAVAHITGLSHETVRDVRDRLRRDENPLPRSARKPRQSRQDHHREQSAVRRQNAPVVPPEVRIDTMKRLSADPGLKYSESGRVLLRLLQVNSLNKQEWRLLGERVPRHCRTLVARLARSCERQWAELAEQLETDVSQP